MTEKTEALRLADALDYGVYDAQMARVMDKAAAELRRLHSHEVANEVWQVKTQWVQDTAKPEELGMHRADVMRQRLERITAQRDALLEALKLARSIIGHPDDAHTQMIDAAIKAVEEGK